MATQLVTEAKLFPADVTLVRFLAGVPTHVVAQRVHSGVNIAADATLVVVAAPVTLVSLVRYQVIRLLKVGVAEGAHEKRFERNRVFTRGLFHNSNSLVCRRGSLVSTCLKV